MLLHHKRIIGIKQNVPLLQHPEQIRRILRRRRGPPLRQHRLPQTLQLRRTVRTNPLDHPARPFGQHRIHRQRLRPRGPRKQFALPLEYRQMLAFQHLANRRNQHRWMLARVPAGQFQTHQQPRRQIRPGNRRRNLRTPCFLEFLVERHCHQRAPRLRQIGDPRPVIWCRHRTPARLPLHCVKPRVHRLLATLGSHSRRIRFKRHAAKPLAVHTPQIRLICMKIRRPQHLSGNPAPRHRNVIPSRRIHLHRLFDQMLRTQLAAFPQMLARLLFRQKQRVRRLPRKHRGMLPANLKHRPATLALRQQRRRNVEQRINTRHLMHLLHNQMQRRRIRQNRHSHPGRGLDHLRAHMPLHATSTNMAATTTTFTATPAKITPPVATTIAQAAVTATTATLSATTILARLPSSGPLLPLVARFPLVSARPGRAQGKIGKQTFQSAWLLRNNRGGFRGRGVVLLAHAPCFRDKPASCLSQNIRFGGIPRDRSRSEPFPHHSCLPQPRHMLLLDHSYATSPARKP